MRRARRNFQQLASSAWPACVAMAFAAPLPAHAQFFTSIGDNLTYPVNFFPINPAAPLLDFTGNAVSIGNSGSGTFVANNGGVLLADKLTIGNSGTGVGGVTVSGIGTQVVLSGASPTNSNRLEVGNWGIGSLSVVAGAVVDATQNAAGCTAPGVFCNSFVGNGAGSSGVLNISGAGSTVSTIGFTGIGWTSVFTVAIDGFNFGTPGGTTNGAVNVTAGGRFNTQTSTVGGGPQNLSATGTEQGIGSVVVDGVGSRWLATRDTVGNLPASVVVGNRVGGTGTVIVRNGGQLLIDGAGSGASAFDGLSIGLNGAHGTVTVSGAGSNITTIGANPFLNVGRSGVTGQGTLEILSGATVDSMLMTVGRDGASGSVLIDGAGSRLNLVGVGTPGVTGGTGVTVGWNAGANGQMTVSNGGQVLISDGGGDTRLANGLGINVGRDAGGTGSLTISGPGSIVRVASTSLGVPATEGDNFNPGVSFGRFAGSTGDLVVTNGGLLWLEGGAVATAANRRNTVLNIGGDGDTVLGGTGTATVSGPGSEIRVSGTDAFIGVGRFGASGSLTVNEGASVSTTVMLVGRGGTGALLVDNASVNLSGQFTGDPTTGAALVLGQRGGTGTAVVTNGSQVNINNLGAAGAALVLGGTGASPLGTGTLTLSGGSQINVSAASGLALFTVGYDGTGTANITQGSTVSLGDGAVFVGQVAGSSGSLNIDGGSKVLAGTANIGGASDTVVGGTGTVVVSGAGSELQASSSSGFIGVGRGGTGSLTVSDQGLVAGTIINVGRATGGVGTLTVDNASIQLSGQQTTGTMSGAALSIGNLGGSGTANITDGSVITITNMGSAGATLNVGGTGNNPLGTGILNVSNSQISINAASGMATLTIGRDGTGTANLTQGSTVDVGDGAAYVGRLAGGSGALNVSGGSKVLAGQIAVGGASDTVAGGIGTATVSGLGSELRASGSVASIAIGQRGNGTVTVSSQGQLTGTVLNVGSGVGGVGTLSVDAGTIQLSGQTSGGQGAALNIGTNGGVGVVSVANGSTVNITNLGSAGASLNVGGAPGAPLGTGTLTVSNSQVNVTAAPGLGAVRIGHDGIGTAIFTSSSLNIGDGSLTIAGQPGSVGSLLLSANSVVNAGYVGVGATPAGQGGVANLIINDSVLNAAKLEIGALSTLSGNNADIHVAGDVIVAGTIGPGNSPGRLRVSCNIITLPGSTLILDILGDGSGFDIDNLIIGNGSTFDLTNFNIVFNFLGETDPNAFAASGGFNLDNFLRSGVGEDDFELSTAFAAGQTWDDIIDSSLITAVADGFVFSGFTLGADGGITVDANRVPEPATWLLMLFGLLVLGALWQRRSAGSLH